jgi:hypothetical protein
LNQLQTIVTYNTKLYYTIDVPDVGTPPDQAPTAWAVIAEKNQFFTVTNVSDLTTLTTATKFDFAKVTSTAASYILNGADPTVANNWVVLGGGSSGQPYTSATLEIDNNAFTINLNVDPEKLQFTNIPNTASVDNASSPFMYGNQPSNIILSPNIPYSTLLIAVINKPSPNAQSGGTYAIYSDHVGGNQIGTFSFSNNVHDGFPYSMPYNDPNGYFSLTYTETGEALPNYGASNTITWTSTPQLTTIDSNIRNKIYSVANEAALTTLTAAVEYDFAETTDTSTLYGLTGGDPTVANNWTALADLGSQSSSLSYAFVQDISYSNTFGSTGPITLDEPVLQVTGNIVYSQPTGFQVKANKTYLFNCLGNISPTQNITSPPGILFFGLCQVISRPNNLTFNIPGTNAFIFTSVGERVNSGLSIIFTPTEDMGVDLWVSYNQSTLGLDIENFQINIIELNGVSSGGGSGAVNQVTSANSALTSSPTTGNVVLTPVVNTAKGLTIGSSGTEVKVDGTTVQFNGQGVLTAPGGSGSGILSINASTAANQTIVAGANVTVNTTPQGVTTISATGGGGGSSSWLSVNSVAQQTINAGGTVQLVLDGTPDSIGSDITISNTGMVSTITLATTGKYQLSLKAYIADWDNTAGNNNLTLGITAGSGITVNNQSKLVFNSNNPAATNGYILDANLIVTSTSNNTFTITANNSASTGFIKLGDGTIACLYLSIAKRG